ncbi:MAG: alpha/beta fold hydrolase [Bacteroidota bacterium]
MKNMIARMMGFYLNVLSLVSPSLAGRKGFLLFCRPFRLSMSGKQLEFLNAAKKSVLTTEGQSIQVYQWGNGKKKILFLHGWQSHSYRWKAYIEAFSKDEYTIYALDAPGHGLSGGNFLSAPLYSAIIEQFINDHGKMHAVISHSLGGFSLLYTFYRNPSLAVNKVILMAPPGNAQDFMDFYRQTLGLSNRTSKRIADHFVSRFNADPAFFSTPKFATSVNVNGLIIHDEQDLEAPYHYATRINEAWKKSRLVTTNGLGHNLKSTEVVKEVVAFVSEPVSEPALA